MKGINCILKNALVCLISFSMSNSLTFGEDLLSSPRFLNQCGKLKGLGSFSSDGKFGKFDVVFENHSVMRKSSVHNKENVDLSSVVYKILREACIAWLNDGSKDLNALTVDYFSKCVDNQLLDMDKNKNFNNSVNDGNSVNLDNIKENFIYEKNGNTVVLTLVRNGNVEDIVGKINIECNTSNCSHSRKIEKKIELVYGETHKESYYKDYEVSSSRS